MPFIHLRESPLYGWNRVAKRVFDFVFSLARPGPCSGPCCSPSPPRCKLTSRGPVLYRQERMGLDGQRFRMLKLRTMRVDAERETGPGVGRARRRAADPHRRLPPALQPRRAAAVRQRAARGDERGGPAAGAAGLRRAVPADRARLHAAPQGQVGHHRLGAGATGCAATPRSRSASSTTSSTSSAGRSGSTSRSSRMTVVRVLFDRNAY